MTKLLSELGNSWRNTFSWNAGKKSWNSRCCWQMTFSTHSPEKDSNSIKTSPPGSQAGIRVKGKSLPFFFRRTFWSQRAIYQMEMYNGVYPARSGDYVMAKEKKRGRRKAVKLRNDWFCFFESLGELATSSGWCPASTHPPPRCVYMQEEEVIVIEIKEGDCVRCALHLIPWSTQIRKRADELRPTSFAWMERDIRRGRSWRYVTRMSLQFEQNWTIWDYVKQYIIPCNFRKSVVPWTMDKKERNGRCWLPSSNYTTVLLIYG